MRKYVFFFREADTDDRDRCAYIENKYNLDCIGNVILHGACYCGRSDKNLAYEAVETFLNKKDYETLISKNVSEKDFNRILKKLTSEPAKEFYNKIVDDEMEYLKDTYSLSDGDIEKIFDEYYLDYKDRGCIGYVYDSLEKFGENEMESCGYDRDIPDFIKDCIDYEKVGEKLADSENYLILDDNRVVSLNY